jgi:hypothetical protein
MLEEMVDKEIKHNEALAEKGRWFYEEGVEGEDRVGKEKGELKEEGGLSLKE